MASRLTVVVSQSLSRNAASADLEETLVAELMMSPGLDATMIGPMERIESDGTDYLCISSFQHSFVVVSWLSDGELQTHWQRLGLSGTVVPIRLNQQDAYVPPAAGEKRIYHVRLESNSKIDSILSRLQQLLADRQVRTVGIDLLSSNVASASSSAKEGSILPVATSPEPASGSAVNDRSSVESTALESTALESTALESSALESAATGAGSKEGVVSHAGEGVGASRSNDDDATSGKPNSGKAVGELDESDQFQHLDQLVDDLDELDL